MNERFQSDQLCYSSMKTNFHQRKIFWNSDQQLHPALKRCTNSATPCSQPRLSMICHCKNPKLHLLLFKALCIVKNLLIKRGLKFPSAKVSLAVECLLSIWRNPVRVRSATNRSIRILLSAEVILSYCLFICDYSFFSSNDPEHRSKVERYTPEWRNCSIILELWYQWNLLKIYKRG